MPFYAVPRSGKKGETPEVGGREIRVLVTPMPDADAAHLADSW